MRTRSWVLVFSVVLAAAIGMILFIYGREQLTVNTISVMQTDFTSTIQSTGKVKTKEESTVFSPGEGTLGEFSVKKGDRVKKGQVIGVLDKSDLDDEIQELQARIEMLQTNLAKLRKGHDPEVLQQLSEAVIQQEINYQAVNREFKQMEQLYRSGAVSKDAYDRKKDQLQQAASALKAAQSNLALNQKGADQEDIAAKLAEIKQVEIQKREMEDERKRYLIVAPISGTVIDCKVKQGQTLVKGSEILTISDLTQLEVDAEVNESDAWKIQLGQDATVEGNSLGNEKLKAKVVRIDPISVTQQKGQIEKTIVGVILQINDQSAYLKPGLHVDVTIATLVVPNALQVPYESVLRDQDGSRFVWIVENGVAKKRTIETGAENGFYMEVKNGLKKGDQVVAVPTDQLKENERVVVMDISAAGN